MKLRLLTAFLFISVLFCEAQPVISGTSATTLNKGKTYSVTVFGSSTTFLNNAPFPQAYLYNSYDTIFGTAPSAVNDSVMTVNFTAPCNSPFMSYSLNALGFGQGLLNLPAAISLLSLSDSTSISGATCGSADGSATVYPIYGNGTFTYSWAPSGGTAATASGLAAGIYNVTMTDSSLCSVTQEITITNPGLSVNNALTTNATCNSICSGADSVTAVGSNSPFTYLWSNSATTSMVTGLCASTYTVQVTDALGCVATLTVAITEPPPVGISLPTLTNVTCNGMCNGDATALGNGGTPPYTYVWSPGGMTTAAVNSLCPGNYTVAVTDFSGCTGNPLPLTINQPSAIVVTPASAPASICSGGSAALSVSVSGGASGYTYSWAPAAGLSCTTCSNPTATPSVTTSYTVTITDAVGCTATGNITITVNVTPTVTFNASTDTICSGGFSNLSVTAPGAISFIWNPAITTGTSVTVNPATTTNYFVTATSAAGCVDSGNVTITVMPAIILSNSPNPVSCYGLSDGSITPTVSGATMPVSYFWSNGATCSVLGGLFAGVYTLNVIDANQCTATSTDTVFQPQPINISFSTTNTNCGQSTGFISATVTQGTSPYTYLWSNGDRTLLADSLSPGQYKLEIVDANWCSGMATENIIAIGGPSVSGSTIGNVSCNGGSDGSLNITLTGGTAPLTLQWATGETTNTISNLSAGLYDVNIMDAVGCGQVVSFTVSEPLKINVSETITAAGCGVSDGAISTAISGGVGGYTYLWSANAGSATTSSTSNLSAGIYSVTVTDANLCSVTQTFGLPTASNNMGIVLDSIGISTCNSNPSGVIMVTTGGNAPPFTFAWSNGNTAEDMFNIMPGEYWCVFSDTNNCNEAVEYVVPNKLDGFKPGICLVTVDSSTFNNSVIWDKTPGIGIASYNIYRETSVQNTYLKIKNIPYDSLSQFNDTVANTDTHSWRYKISAVDSCGTETVLSDYQKTIHLIIKSDSLNAHTDLLWDYYAGVPSNQYLIYRQLGAGWQLIDSVPNAVLNYSDMSPPAYNLDYMIEAQLPYACVPAMRLSNGNSAMAIVNTSRSNIKHQLVAGGVGIKKNTLPNVSIFPNPASNEITIKTGSEKIKSIEIKNMLGQIVLTENSFTQSPNDPFTHLINISQLHSGIYFVNVIAEDGKRIAKKIVKE